MEIINMVSDLDPSLSGRIDVPCGILGPCHGISQPRASQRELDLVKASASWRGFILLQPDTQEGNANRSAQPL